MIEGSRYDADVALPPFDAVDRAVLADDLLVVASEEDDPDAEIGLMRVKRLAPVDAEEEVKQRRPIAARPDRERRHHEVAIAPVLQGRREGIVAAKVLREVAVPVPQHLEAIAEAPVLLRNEGETGPVHEPLPAELDH